MKNIFPHWIVFKLIFGNKKLDYSKQWRRKYTGSKMTHKRHTFTQRAQCFSEELTGKCLQWWGKKGRKRGTAREKEKHN